MNQGGQEAKVGVLPDDCAIVVAVAVVVLELQSGVRCLPSCRPSLVVLQHAPFGLVLHPLVFTVIGTDAYQMVAPVRTDAVWCWEVPHNLMHANNRSHHINSTNH